MQSEFVDRQLRHLFPKDSVIFPRESAHEGTSTAGENEDWRDQVASRVNNYRERRGRKLEGEFSMRFDFEPLPERQDLARQPIPPPDPLPDISFETPLATAGTDLSFLDAVDPVTAPPPQDPPAPDWSALSAHAEDANTNLIEFPRSATLIPVYEVAEPVLDKPRILDVPEQPAYPTISGPLFADLSFSDLTPHEPPPEVFGPPVPIATIQQRVFAALVDGTLVATGIVLFLVIVLSLMDSVPPARDLAVLTATAVLSVWIAYEYLFLVHGEGTPGMRLFKLQLVNFSGEPAPQRQRGYRALALLMSGISLFAGFFWAFADEDTLCWHDRMSQTYLSR